MDIGPLPSHSLGMITPVPMRLARTAGVVLGVVAWFAPSPAGAADPPSDPCERLFVPEGYQLTCTVEGGPERDWVARVAPSDDDGFGGLTELTMEPVEGPIDEPQFWLREQMTVDVSGVEHGLRDLLEDPDSPLADVPLEDQARELIQMMHALGQLPLRGCEEPVSLEAGKEASGSVHEIACSWQLGPFTQYMNVRLLQRGGDSYVFHMRAANERRLRHLRAIASSF